MNFYTLTYDADLPAVQQVNVPTNSDYKVGMKVKRNGSVQSIKPSEFTVYTGEVNVIPPTEWGGTSLPAETQSSSLGFTANKDDACAALAGQTIKAKDFYLEASYDNGATWHKLTAQNHSIAQLTLNDRATGKNASIARLDFNKGNLVWYIKDSDPQWSETVEEIQMPERMGVAMNTVASNWNIASVPCLVRIGCSWGGSEQRVTYPVDQEKTNGYVTITKASGDNASFKQYGVHIDKGYDFNDVWKITGQFGPTETTPPANFTKPSAEELGIVGITIDGKQFADTAMKIIWSNASTPAPANPDDWGNWRSFDINTYVVPYQIGYEGETAVYLVKADPNAVPAGTVLPDGTVVQEGYNFLRQEPGAQNYSQASTTWTMTEDSYIYQGATRFRANYYFGTAWKFQLGTPFSADFKLNINEFKSQSGDIAETLADNPTVKVDGTYADGTTFSFDFCTK